MSKRQWMLPGSNMSSVTLMTTTKWLKRKLTSPTIKRSPARRNSQKSDSTKWSKECSFVREIQSKAGSILTILSQWMKFHLRYTSIYLFWIILMSKSHPNTRNISAKTLDHIMMKAQDVQMNNHSTKSQLTHPGGKGQPKWSSLFQ